MEQNDLYMQYQLIEQHAFFKFYVYGESQNLSSKKFQSTLGRIASWMILKEDQVALFVYKIVSLYFFLNEKLSYS